MARKGGQGGISGNAKNVIKAERNEENGSNQGIQSDGFYCFTIVLCVKVKFRKSHLGGPKLEGDQAPKVGNWTMSKKLEIHCPY